MHKQGADLVLDQRNKADHLGVFRDHPGFCVGQVDIGNVVAFVRDELFVQKRMRDFRRAFSCRQNSIQIFWPVGVYNSFRGHLL